MSELQYMLCDRGNSLYHYHPDHLGSASWITDAAGSAIQHLQYTPFGEPRLDQRTTAWNTMFSFSGKERDTESSYSYFGARYYDSQLSLWLSVDPKASSYPSLTPYNYCANNPVILKDPNGESLSWWQWGLIALGADMVTGGAISAVAGTIVSVGIGTALGTIGAVVGAVDGAVGGMITGTVAAYFPFSNTNYELQKYISPIAIKPPSFGFGSLNSVGFDVSFGMMKRFGLLPSYCWHAGVSYQFGSNAYGGHNGWETRTGAEFSIGGIGISGTKFNAGGDSQTINKITVGGPFTNVSYENDMMFGLGAVLGRYEADGGDRLRTAAVAMNFGPFSINLNMFTGDPGLNVNNRPTVWGDDGFEYYASPSANDSRLRAGVLSFGFGPFHIGRNSEAIRNAFQNELIHKNMGYPLFEVRPIPPKWFFYFGTGSGNTLWE